MCEIDERSSHCFHLIDKLFGEVERSLHVEVEIVAHGAIHKGEGMYPKVSGHIVFKVEEAERVGDACAETGLRGETHRIVVTDIQLYEFLVTTWQIHPQEMLPTLGERAVQHL